MVQTIAFICIQALSLAFMLLFVHQYKQIIHKHEYLLEAIERGSKPQSTREGAIITWIYIILTFIIFLSTSSLFILTNDYLS